MNKITLVFENAYRIGYASVISVTGASGIKHASAVLIPDKARHQFQMEAEAYYRVADDIAKGSAPGRSVWRLAAVLVEQEPASEREAELLDQIDKLKADLEALKSVQVLQPVEPEVFHVEQSPEVPQEPESAASDTPEETPGAVQIPNRKTMEENMGFRQVRKVAKDIGVQNIDALNTKPALIEAIESRRAELLTA